MINEHKETLKFLQEENKSKNEDLFRNKIEIQTIDLNDNIINTKSKMDENRLILDNNINTVKKNMPDHIPPNVLQVRRVYRSKENAKHIKKIVARRNLLREEKRKGGGAVLRFKMGRKLFGAMFRRRDTSAAMRIRSEHGNNTDINYRSYRIFTKWNAIPGVNGESDDDKRARIRTAASDAFDWQLSFNMLSPAVMADKAEEVKKFYEQARLLAAVIDDPEYEDCFSEVSRDRMDLLKIIIDTAQPLTEALELSLDKMGLSMNEEGAIFYKDAAATDEQTTARNTRLSELRSNFTEKRDLLDEADERVINESRHIGDTSLLPKHYFREDTEAGKIFDRVSKNEGFDTIDALFAATDYTLKKNGKQVNISSAKERADIKKFYFSVMEKNDINFKKPDEYIKKASDKMREELELHNRLFPKLSIKESVLDYEISHVLAPTVKRVFALVNAGKIGKDVARMYMHPDVMKNGIEDIENSIYKSLTFRKINRKDISNKEFDELSNEYDEGVKKLCEQELVEGKKEFDPYFDKLKTDEFFSQDDVGTDTTYCTKENGELKYIANGSGGFLFFPVNRTEQDVGRCYVTTKNQGQLLGKLADLMKRKPEYARKFHFKVSYYVVNEKKDNMVLYIKKSTDVKLLKQFLADLAEEGAEFLDEENVKTAAQLNKGISVVSEPSQSHMFSLLISSNTFGKAFKKTAGGIHGKNKKDDYLYPALSSRCAVAGTIGENVINPNTGEPVRIERMNISWNQYYSRLLTLSAIVAKHRLGYSDNDKKISQDPKVLREIKQVMQEFLEVSNINVETMMTHDSDELGRTLLGKN